MESIFHLEGLKVEFNNRAVLDIESLDFEKGLVYALIGPSGAGKSTLLRVLNLLQKPSKGQVDYLGQKLNYESKNLALQQTMAMVFQKPAMFSGDVFYNVSLGLKLRKVSQELIRQKVAEALEMVGMKGYEKRSATTLSGGEAQRIAIARALVLDPTVLLLDEPTANLDPSNVAIIEDIIKRIHKEKKTTIIIVTHNLYQAKRLADETIFLNRGKVVEKGKNLFTNPNKVETKQFVSGEMIY